MERNAVGLIFELLIDFEVKPILLSVRPNFDCSIDACRCDERLLDARVHSVDLFRMERHHHVAIVDFITRSFDVQHDLYDLLVFSWEDKRVFWIRQIDAAHLRAL